MFFPRARILFFLLAFAAVFRPTPQAEAYALLGYSWPDGTQIVIHLNLVHSPNSIQDGTGSWNGSAADALNIWNQYINRVKFVAGDAISGQEYDGANSAFFSNSVYGMAWPNSALAVTLKISTNGNYFTETDVIFNNKLKWSSYRGPIIGSGTSTTYDFHRTALHEFGHVLGLDHPDEHGQSVEAIMNSTISNLDHLADDDIAGAQYLYGLHITSPQYSQSTTSGSAFSYQVTADNSPTSFSAVGLPAGLQIDPTTGLISGHCTTSGTFTISITAQGPTSIATGTFQLYVYPQPLTSPSFPPAVLIGDSFTYQTTANNSPTSFSASALPAGLSLDPNTGLISGTPTQAGNYSVTVNATGASAKASGIIYISIVRPTITSDSSRSADIGSMVSYTITSNNRPTSFSVSNLPSGLHLDAASGQITGVATLSGSFNITLIAHGAAGDATANLNLYVRAIDVPTSYVSKVSMPIDYMINQILADPHRDRIYLAGAAGITVLDSLNFTVLKVIPTSLGIRYMSLSPDANRLWLAGYYDHRVEQIDLEGLVSAGTVTTANSPRRVFEAGDGRLYVTDYYDYQHLYQLDAASGAALGSFAPDPSVLYYFDMEVAPDGQTLYFAVGNNSGSLLRYKIVPGSLPILQQKVPTPVNNFIGLTASPDNRELVVASQPVSSSVTNNFFFSPGDLSIPGNAVSPTDSDSLVAFSKNSALAFLTSPSASKINLYDCSSHVRQRSIGLEDLRIIPNNSWLDLTVPLAVERSDTYLFVSTGSSTGSTAAIYVYSLVPPAPATAPDHSVLNVSTRLRTQTGDNLLIGGFIINGADPKQVILRATGPSLPVTGALADPVLELHNPDGSIVTNDNWNEHRGIIVASGIPPTDEHESAIVATLPPGAYTAVLRGLNDTIGVALVELYDLTPNSNSRIANISTRGKVETDANVMIGGFIIGGTQPTKVIVRAIGPSLTGNGVIGALADTILELHDPNGALLASNDDWQSDQEQEIIATTIAPTDPHESAIVRTLTPGSYTAIVRGKNNTTGVALVEVYNLESN